MSFLSKLFKRKDTKELETKIDKLVEQNKELIYYIQSQTRDTSTNDYLLEASNNRQPITNFELKGDQIGIKFNAISSEEFINKIPQIHLNKENQEIITGTLSNLVGGVSNTTITSFATQGLFKATANPSTLMKLASGGVGSSVVNNGVITQQAGFIQAGSTMFTPMVVFQIASMITGQYYMNNISKQLNSVQEKLDELLTLFHIERQAKLIKSFKFITENLNKKNFAIEDFVLLKLILSELTDVREEYFLMIEDSVKNIRKSNEYNSINSLTEAKYISNEFNKTGFLFKMQTSLIADELYHLAKITEFHMNLCYKNPDINRLSLLSEKLSEITNFKQEELSFNKTAKLYAEVKGETLHWLNYSKNESWFNTDDIKKIEHNLKNQFNEFEKNRNTKLSTINQTYGNISKPFLEEKTIIIDNRTNDIKLYIE